ncbi:MAG: glycosyltransferase family 2 protein [Geobacter sp.]|nr:MAG: glycosyltransferase family 2 protein [Geobacter sp.]
MVEVYRRVSIVIVSHDLKEYLKRCILSIEKKTERELIEEIVIVDNGSSEKFRLEDLTTVTSFPVSLVRLEENASYSHANNRGVAAAGGYYICFMNNDVEVLPEWLFPLYEIINSDLKIGAVGPKMIFPDGSIQFAGYEINHETGFQKHAFRNAKVNHSVKEANVAGPVSNLTGACLLVRKEDALLDERYWYGCEDTDLCVQLKQKNKIVFYQPQSVVIHHEEVTRASGLISVDYEKNRELFRGKWGRNWKQFLWQVVK